MGQIFISYSHKDKEYVHKLARALEHRGFDAWYDDEIDYGSRWEQEIEDHLRNCDAVILVASTESNNSEWVENEIHFAKSKRKPIFPLLIEGEDWLSLGAIQYVDVRGGKMPPDKFYVQLQEAMKDQVSAHDSTPVAAPPAPWQKARSSLYLPIGIGVIAVILLALIGMKLFAPAPVPPPTASPTETATLVPPSETPTVVPTPTKTPFVTDTPTPSASKDTMKAQLVITGLESAKAPVTFNFSARGSFLQQANGTDLLCSAAKDCKYTWLVTRDGKEVERLPNDSNGAYGFRATAKGTYVVSVRVCRGDV